MKKSTIVFLFFGFFQNFCFASEIPVHDVETVESEFKKLNQLESYINQNVGITLESIKTTNPELLAGLNLEQNTGTSSLKSGELPGNLPPFVWGCCLGVIGLAAVYFTSDNDKDMVKKAAFGCLVNGAVIGGGCLLYSLFGNGYYY